MPASELGNVRRVKIKEDNRVSEQIETSGQVMDFDLIDGSLDNAGVRIFPPLLLLIMIILGFFVSWLLPLNFLPIFISKTAGPIITGVSFILVLWAVYAMRREGASIPTGTPTKRMVLSGPYSFSRNPIYLAMLLLQIGIGLSMNSFWFLLFAVVSFFLLVWGVISQEEFYLERKFGAEYMAYKTRVRRWF